MKVETKEIYKCEYCNKLYQIKRFAEYHEKICHKNPENNRPCFDCTYLEKKINTVENENGICPLDLFYCKLKNVYVYPPKVEIKGSYFDLGYTANEPMPKTCNDLRTTTNN